MKTNLLLFLLFFGIFGSSFGMGHPHNRFAARKRLQHHSTHTIRVAGSWGNPIPKKPAASWVSLTTALGRWASTAIR